MSVALGAGAVLAHAVAAARRLEMLLVAVVDQGVEAVAPPRSPTSPPLPPSPPSGPPNSMNFSRRKPTTPGPPSPLLRIDLGLVEEFHGFNVNKCQQMSSSAGGGDAGWNAGRCRGQWMPKTKIGGTVEPTPDDASPECRMLGRRYSAAAGTLAASVTGTPCTETKVRPRMDLRNFTWPSTGRTGCGPCRCRHWRRDGTWCRADGR